MNCSAIHDSAMLFDLNSDGFRYIGIGAFLYMLTKSVETFVNTTIRVAEVDNSRRLSNKILGSLNEFLKGISTGVNVALQRLPTSVPANQQQRSQPSSSHPQPSSSPPQPLVNFFTAEAHVTSDPVTI